MQENEYLVTTERHVATYERGDKAMMDQLLRYYQGKFYTSETGQSESDLERTSVGLTFAIVETALTSLVSPNPAITAVARNRAEEERIRACEAFVNNALDASNYRQEQGLYVFDSVLYGRGITKTAWSAKKDNPVVRATDVRTTFFDLTARRPDDIRYWIEATLLSSTQFKERIRINDYASWAGEINPDAYPKWMLTDTGATVDRESLKNYQKWHVVYEIHDLEADKVVHIIPGDPRPVMVDKLVYNPYDLTTLNTNGEDCRGLSEIALISPNQEEVNNLLTYWLNIVRACVPKGVYDPGELDGEQLGAAAKAGLNTWSPIRRVGGKSKGPLSDAIGMFPMPQVPPEALALLDKVWNNITIVSALAEAQRGQVTGARTATELALIEGQLRNRLSGRQKRIDAITSSVAEKMLLLMQKYKKNDEVLQQTGVDGWSAVSPDTLEGVKAAFKVVPYTAMESNRAVVQEQFKEFMMWAGKNPACDQRKLLQATVDIFDNPALRRYNIVLPEQVEAQEAAEAGAGAPPPGGPSPEVLAAAAGQPPAATAVPPQMQAILAAQAGTDAMNSPLIAPPGVPPGMPALA